MKKAVLGALFGAGLVVLAAGVVDRSSTAARSAVANVEVPEAGLIALSSASADNAQLVTLVDPHGRAMAVYRVDSLSGKIKLLSVRKIQWDLQTVQYNSEAPLPQEIHSLLEQK